MPKKLGAHKYPYEKGKIHRNHKQAKVRKCHKCGRKFWVAQSHARKHDRIFCNRDCYHSYRKGRTDEFNNNTEEAKQKNREAKLGPKNPMWKDGSTACRRMALEMFGEKCQECGATEDLQVHHKDMNPRNNPLDGSNWLVLCRSCHAKGHRFIDNFGNLDMPEWIREVCSELKKNQITHKEAGVNGAKRAAMP